MGGRAMPRPKTLAFSLSALTVLSLAKDAGAPTLETRLVLSLLFEPNFPDWPPGVAFHLLRGAASRLRRRRCGQRARRGRRPQRRRGRRQRRERASSDHARVRAV